MRETMPEDLKSFIHYLEVISDRGVRSGLERMREAVALLGHPEEQYPIIHLAGTNGKGTTCQFIAQMLSASGYKVGLTLSPHVDDYRERIQISNPDGGFDHIPPSDLLQAHDLLLQKLPPELGLTYFEWGILLAYVFFAMQKVDFAVVETGMGGRWDASNVTAHSAVSGITSIGLDHQEYLGDSLQKILNEKLQIIKSHSDFVFDPDDPALSEQARQHCTAVGARFHSVPELSRRFEEALPFRWDHEKRFFREHLLFSLAVGRCLEGQGYRIDYGKFLSQDLILPPSRLEVISTRPHIIRDGAHNEPALLRLRAYLEETIRGDYDLVFGCLNTRDFMKLAGIIRPSGQCYWARFDAGQRTTEDNVYQQVQKAYGGEVVALEAAFRERLLKRDEDRPIVVCGSFYLCAQFKKMWDSIPFPLATAERGPALQEKPWRGAGVAKRDGPENHRE